LQELVVVVPENHRLASSGSIALADLSAEVFLVIRQSLNPAYLPAFEGLCERAGFSPRIGSDTVEFDEDLSAVRAGRGILVTTRDYGVAGLPGTRLLELDPPESLPVELATLDGEMAPALGRFVELARELRNERGWTSVARAA
jgi:DNA-binding transcriptional LysR family regulator